MSTEETSVNKQNVDPPHPDFKVLCAVNHMAYALLSFERATAEPTPQFPAQRIEAQGDQRAIDKFPEVMRKLWENEELVEFVKSFLNSPTGSPVYAANIGTEADPVASSSTSVAA